MITERHLHNECLGLAQDLVLEARQAASKGDHSFSMSDRIHETIDSHEWVIYNGKAQAVCMAATMDEICEAEQALTDRGYGSDGEGFDFWKMQTLMAFQIMHFKVADEVLNIDNEVWS